MVILGFHGFRCFNSLSAVLRLKDTRHLKSNMVSAQRKKEQGNWIAAVDIYRRIISSDPDYIDAYCELARLFIEQDRVREAEDLMVEATSREPDNAECAFLGGLISYISGRFADAIKYYRMVEEKSGLDPSLRINIALVYEAQGNYELAIKYLEPVIREPACTWKVFEVLSDLYLSTRQINRAAQVLEMGIKKFPGQGNLHFLLGSAYYKVRNYAKAAQHLSSAQKNIPMNHTLQEQLGVSLINVGQLERGIGVLKPFFEEEPWNLDVGLELAKGYRLADQPRSAQKILKRLLDQYPDDKRITNELARIRHLLTHTDEFETGFE